MGASPHTPFLYPIGRTQKSAKAAREASGQFARWQMLSRVVCFRAHAPAEKNARLLGQQMPACFSARHLYF